MLIFLSSFFSEVIAAAAVVVVVFPLHFFSLYIWYSMLIYRWSCRYAIECYDAHMWKNVYEDHSDNWSQFILAVRSLTAKKLASPDVYERTAYKINAKWICLDGRKSACGKVRLTIKKNIGNYIYFYYTWRMQWPMKQNVCNAIVGTSWCALALMYTGFLFSFVQLFTFIIISISFLFYTLQFFVIFCFSIVQMCVRRSVAVLLLLVLRL